MFGAGSNPDFHPDDHHVVLVLEDGRDACEGSIPTAVTVGAGSGREYPGFGQGGEFRVLEEVRFNLLGRVEDPRGVVRVGCRCKGQQPGREGQAQQVKEDGRIYARECWFMHLERGCTHSQSPVHRITRTTRRRLECPKYAEKWLGGANTGTI